MKKTQLLIILLCFWATLLNAQQIAQTGLKPILDTAILGKWPTLSYPAISPYGRFVSYYIHASIPGQSGFTIKDTSGAWQKDYPGNLGQILFSADEHQALLYRNDSLRFIALGENQPDHVIPVRSFWPATTSSTEWIAYEEKGGSGEELILRNLLNNKLMRLGKVSEYRFDPSGSTLWISNVSGDGNSLKTELSWMDLLTGSKHTVWTGNIGDKLARYSLSDNGEKLSMVVSQRVENHDVKSIWYYQKGMAKPIFKIKEGDPRIDAGLKIDGGVEFNFTGNWMFFQLTQPIPADSSNKPKPDAVKVDLWSYKDKLLEPEQSDQRLNIPKQFYAVMSTEGDTFRCLERPGFSLMTSPKGMSGDWVIMSVHSKADRGVWSMYTDPESFSLFSLSDGTWKPLPQKSITDFWFSPNGRWLVYYDYKKENYFSFDIVSGSLNAITAKIPVQFSGDYRRGDYYNMPGGGLAGWIKENGNVLIFDNYDLWQIDPAGKKSAINITGGYGRSHHMKLRLIGEKKTYSLSDTSLFTGFNIKDKTNGFLRKILGTKGIPELCYVGPYTFYRAPSQKPHPYAFDDGMEPIKASNANCWIVQRESAMEAPNYFASKDLKSFRPLTHLAPQNNCNWLKTELINYRQADGTWSQGVLYKPENFDPAKKYPVIFNFYEQLSHRVYEFPRAEYMEENLNIPWFVSRGYLVFTPDIHYEFANRSGKIAGEYAYNSIIAAAEYLAKLSYVDGKRMGLQGHSFGAEETNYLITHSHLFAAASEMAGGTDPVSEYLTLVPTLNNPEENEEEQTISEYGQLRIGATLWQRPDLYLKGSTVLRADQITTPLLIVHNKKDVAVPWRQGIELYMALRRLKKPSWMLQYDNESHWILQNPADQKDYTIRMTQFFDHYLKGYPPPSWMTRGVPAKMKGVETGYELDPKGECSPDCPICKKKEYKNFDPKLAVIKEFAKDPPPADTN